MSDKKSPSLWERAKAVASSLRDTAVTYLTPQIEGKNIPLVITNPVSLILSTRAGRALTTGIENAVVDNVTFVTGLLPDTSRTISKMATGKEHNIFQVGKYQMMGAEEQTAAYHKIRERVTGEKRAEYKEGTLEHTIERVGFWGTNLAGLAGIVKSAGKFALRQGFERAPEITASLSRTFGKNADVGALRFAYADDIAKPAATGARKIVERSDSAIGYATLGSVGTSIGAGIIEGLTALPAAKRPTTIFAHQESNISKALIVPAATVTLTAAAPAKPDIEPLKTSLNSEALQLARESVINKVMSPDYLTDPKTGGFDHDKLDKLQELLVESGHLSASHKTGMMNSHTVKAIDAAIRAGVNSDNLSDGQRDIVAQNTHAMYQSLHETPPDGSSFDPRVLSFQTNAHFLKLYTGNIDGLAGIKTATAGAQFGAILEQSRSLQNPQQDAALESKPDQTAPKETVLSSAPVPAPQPTGP